MAPAPGHRLANRDLIAAWPALPYEDWRETRDTLHAHTQALGKLAVVLAPPEPQLRHAALRLTARGWETAPLPAPDGSGAIVAALDLRAHEAVVEHNARPASRIALTPHRPVGEVASEMLDAVRDVLGMGVVFPGLHAAAQVYVSAALAPDDAIETPEGEDSLPADVVDVAAPPS